MKQILLLCILANSLFIKADAQIERITYCENSNYSWLVNPLSATDDAGNIYLFVKRMDFDSEIEFVDPVTGMSQPLYLFKLDSSGKTLWKQLIPEKFADVSGIFIKNNAVFVTHYVAGTCLEAATRGIWPVRIECSSLFNKSDGKVISNKCFCDGTGLNPDSINYRSDSCPQLKPVAVFMHRDGSVSFLKYSCVYYDMDSGRGPAHTGPGVLYNMTDEKRNDTLGFAGKSQYFPIDADILYAHLMYDEYDDQYIVYDTTRISTYDHNWKLALSIDLPGLGNLKGHINNLTCNSDYYAIHYYADSVYYVENKYCGSCPWNIRVHYLAVFTKSGKQVSFSKSAYYETIKISQENIIYAIAVNKPPSITTSPALLTMDTHQNVLSKTNFTTHFVSGSAISFTKNNELIITGTEFQYANRPMGIYYYREKLK